MRANRGRSGFLTRRSIGVCLALALSAALAPSAGGVTSGQVDAAKAKVERLKREIAAQKVELSRIQAQTAAVATKVSAAKAKFDQITQELLQTQRQLQAAQDKYDTVRTRLDERAREAYMNGPASGIEFLLGATSLTDLSDRIEFVDAVAQSDADLANEVQNLKNQLSAQAKRQEALQEQQANVVNELNKQMAALQAEYDRQRSLIDSIQRKEAYAERVAQKLGREYLRQLAAAFGGHIGNGIFKICPVGDPHGVGNDFGAPRYSGGYHPHAGNDIFAPEGTPIYAPFDGDARDSYDGLGGNAVYVYGSLGYVYNAHLSAYGASGPVHTGDVIGYVGSTGDAQGGAPHDHFEWHPNVIPADWPTSPYGYKVIGTAVNPNPLLSAVC